MLEHVRLHVDDAGDEDLVIGIFSLPRSSPLVLVPAVGSLERDGRGPALEDRGHTCTRSTSM
jgi:hypothetical protein